MLNGNILDSPQSDQPINNSAEAELARVLQEHRMRVQEPNPESVSEPTGISAQANLKDRLKKLLTGR